MTMMRTPQLPNNQPDDDKDKEVYKGRTMTDNKEDNDNHEDIDF